MDNLFTLDVHEAFMSRALELARQGMGKVSPNPMVGCILVKDGEIIGEGYHEEFGGAHAEVSAFNNARKDPVNSTAYITMEPCCITGKTPPCTDALIQNSISDVFIGMLDPNLEINGKGVEALEQAGITVHIGAMGEEAEKLNRPFTKWVTMGMPLVIAKVAQTADGYMGIDSETSVGLTGEKARGHCHRLRSQVDAILIGRQTAEIDNPALTVRDVRGTNPKRVILDTNRTLPLGLNIFQDRAAQTIVLCSKERFHRSETHFCKYLPVQEENKKLSTYDILTTLAQEGITSILIEGGREVLQSFITADLIDQIYIYTSSHNLDNASLINPIQLSDEWKVLEDVYLGKDKLIMAEKGVACLQEL
jgi:diaminohydroxyphosphoribosylaminopyrimidine deaminase/5-amino-6-(5-phosphoribosylamino)uracil reductase